MKTILWIIAGGGIVLGQTSLSSPGRAIEWTATGLAFVLLWYLVTKQGPRERKEAQEDARVEREATRTHTEAVVDKVCDQFAATQKQQHEDTMAINTEIRELAVNCAAQPK